jgi:predicted nuclease of predicted toxin-antitoxin system
LITDFVRGAFLADRRTQDAAVIVEVSGLGPDPGDQAIIGMAARENRILVTIDTDFGRLI